MRISTKGRYALRLMLDIAMNDAEGKPVRVKVYSRYDSANYRRKYGAGSLSGRRKRSLRKNGRMHNDSSLEKAERGNQRGARPYDIS